MIKVFILSPAGNLDYARAAMFHARHLGEAPLALSCMLNDLDDDDTRAPLRWLTGAMFCVVYDDFGITPEMKEGMERAAALNIPCLHRKLTDTDRE